MAEAVDSPCIVEHFLFCRHSRLFENHWPPRADVKCAAFLSLENLSTFSRVAQCVLF